MDALNVIHTALIAVPPIIGTELCKKGVSEAYDKVKALICERFGAHSDLIQALAKVEEKPDSTARQGVLREELEAANAASLPELGEAAAELLKRLEEQPGGVQHIQTVTGNYNAVASHGSTASVNVSHVWND